MKITLKEYCDTKFDASKEAVAQALVAVKEENRKSEIAAEKRFDLLNELRGDVATKAEIKALEKIVDELKDRLTLIDGKSKGKTDSWVYVVGAVGLAAGIIGIITAFLK